MRFRNRTDAGRHLAAQLTAYAGRSDVIVLGLPRGGIPVAHEVTTRLKAPLDVFLVLANIRRKGHTTPDGLAAKGPGEADVAEG